MKLWKKVVLGLVLVFALFVIICVARLGELKDLGIARLTGFPGFRSYLIVFQNDAERRPTGGFITAYATLKFRFGIPFIKFGNVYDEKLIQDGVLPPNDLVAQLLSGPLYPGHGFRDGNIDPDWPTSAQELIRLYQLGYPKADFDGVMAVDFTAFESLVQTVSPESIAEEGLFTQIESDVQGVDTHDPEALQNRKNFLADLAKSLVKKTIVSPTLHDDAADSVVKSLDQKHILFYFADEELQRRAVEKNWTGELPFMTDSDLLVVNEGNYGGMKSSRYIVRDIEYDVEFREGQEGLEGIANLNISLAHRGDAAEPISGYYKSLWRVYTPLGSEHYTGWVDRDYDDQYRQIWGRVIKMNPGEEREIALRYGLPDFVLEDGVYRLKLVKQAGSSADHYRVTVKVPQGYLLGHSMQDTGNRTQYAGHRKQDTGNSFDLRENLAIFETNLNEDLDLSLKILSDVALPRLAWQEFVGGIETIDLRFNEGLDAASVANATFGIKDLDYRNEITDPVHITNVRFIEPQNIRLDLTGVTEECREWYEVAFDGVADKQGNILSEQKITVVQWLNRDGLNCDPNREL